MRDDGQIVNRCRGGDQRIHHQVVRLAMHQLGSDPKAGSIQREQVVEACAPADPGLDHVGLGRIALTGDLDSGLQLPERHGRHL